MSGHLMFLFYLKMLCALHEFKTVKENIERNADSNTKYRKK